MADAPQQEDRTHAATPRRLQRAREEGQVQLSRELQSLAGLSAVILVVLSSGGTITRQLANRLVVFVANPDLPSLSGEVVFRMAWIALVYAAGPFVIASLLGACITGLLQTGFLFHIATLLPTAGRINPLAGFRRLFGAENLAEAGKSLLKIAVMAATCWLILRGDFAGLMLVPRRDAGALLAETMPTVTHILLAVIALQALIAGADVAWVRFRYAQRLRMSHHDLREEQRETEGDPRIKARIKQIRVLRARRRMMAAVPKATVVVTNPTHYAVALTYDRAKADAPRVVAKGVDSLAARIREVAQANRVPLVANPPLAHALYRVELDREIPPEHYQAVAEIIAYVWRLRRPARTVLDAG